MRQIVAVSMAVAVVAGCAASSSDDWTQDFGIEKRTLSAAGEGRYFVLKPGFQLVLEGGGEKIVITVLNETERVGSITTRVVEERETQDGRLTEVSRNYFAIDPATGDVFYFGEAVDEYENGQVVSHGGAWRADEPGCKPGLLVPGRPVGGDRYYQEIAPGKAMDPAESVSVTATLRTPAGLFTDCLKTEETSALKAGKSLKTYAPGIGLIQDEDLLLTSYGYVQ
ncbi:MAG: hypothetical protein JW993_17475 [Sedimentisphaerales bacterium]|nr:hypothetical protein [Sedimentisphaerales bacterium]